MSYKYSNDDRHNLDWFTRDHSKATLLSADLKTGSFRGLSNAHLRFRYPITAIAGRNGTGKTTALALVACAFHNSHTAYNPLSRRYPYYTFSEFFIQTSEEVAPQGIQIIYEMLHDKWRPTAKMPDGKGRSRQRRWKRYGGKWNDYDLRLKRNVIFYGIDRIVPATERSVYRSYRRRFTDQPAQGWEDEVKSITSRVLGKPYDRLWFKSHKKYRLPMMELGGVVLSGFNMGAGENALINILSGILACKESVLVVIDEIELGLHEEAQLRLVRELKRLCQERHIQIICTTHSPAILGALPPEARLFLEDSGGVIEGISVDYAAGRLSGSPQAILDILVEDEVAKAMVNHSLRASERARVRILPIGSAAAVVRHLASRRRDSHAREAIIFLDGDMSANRDGYCDLFQRALEAKKTELADKDWFTQRLAFLPGDAWPERWVVSALLSTSLTAAAEDLGVEELALRKIFERSLLQLKHEEYRHIAGALSLDESYIRERLTKFALTASSEACTEMHDLIEEALGRISR